MRIVYVFPELTIKGGADRIIIEKANYFALRGHEVIIVTESQMGRPTSFPLDSSVKHIDMGLDFNKQYKQSFWGRAFTYITLMYEYKKKLKNILIQEKPDIVITTLGRSLEFLTDIPDGSVKIGEAHTTKLHLRSFDLMKQRGGIYKLIASYERRKMYRNVSKLKALVLLTPEDAEDWKGMTKTYVIPNPLQEIPTRYSSLDNKQAIMVGRYNDRHLGDTVILHNPTNQIMEKYLESSICVLSSRYEGFSMVLAEAMSCGVPCVAFDCPHGPRHIIRHLKDGILVDYLNIQALADGICRLIEDESLRRQLGANARNNILRFSKDKIMKKWDNLFVEIIHSI